MWTPNEERSSHLTPRKKRRWVEGYLPLKGPRQRGWLVTGTLVSRVGQVEDIALCPPFLARHSLFSPALGRQAGPCLLSYILEPSSQAPSLCIPYPRGVLYPHQEMRKKEQSQGCSNAERQVPSPTT